MVSESKNGYCKKKKIKTNSAAHGFSRKKSIITNALVHINQDHFLKVDIKDFFSTIKINRVIPIFEELGYSKRVSFYLSSLVCYKDYLPQGSPASPIISNIVSRNMDCRLVQFAKHFDLRYTRYADDIAFTVKKITVSHLNYVKTIINECGFSVNEKKTKLQQKRGKRILTGISISKEKIEAPKAFKRSLKQELYYIQKYGLTSHMREKKIKNPYYKSVLLGKLQFWRSIEPENVFVNYSIDLLNDINP